MSNLSILKTAIRQHENLFSLNDLHQASGTESRHKPANFIRLDTTQELISEIQQEDPNAKVILVKNGIGTYACEELALSYAMWISPKFHLVVLRAFIAMHKGELQNQQQTLPLVPKDLLDIAMRLKAYAVEYGRFQQSISSTAHDPKAQNDFIASAFSSMNDESYLFVFKPNIKRDLELAEQLLFKYATQ